MGIPGGDPKEYDYRKLPRVSEADRRDKRLSIAVSSNELELLRQKAIDQGLPMSDYVLRRCLGVGARPNPRPRRSDI